MKSIEVAATLVSWEQWFLFMELLMRRELRQQEGSPETGDPATDANKPIRFTLYNKAGAVVWDRIS